MQLRRDLVFLQTHSPVRCIEILMEDVGSRDRISHGHSCNLDCRLLPFPCAACFLFLHEQTGPVGGTLRLRVPCRQLARVEKWSGTTMTRPADWDIKTREKPGRAAVGLVMTTVE